MGGLVVAHRSMAKVAAGLAVAWDTANTAALTQGKRMLINGGLPVAGAPAGNMMYPLVRELAAKDAPVRVPVTVTCRVLKIARAPSYRWLAAPVAAASWSKGPGFADLTASSIELKSSIAFLTRSCAFNPRSVAGISCDEKAMAKSTTGCQVAVAWAGDKFFLKCRLWRSATATLRTVSMQAPRAATSK